MNIGIDIDGTLTAFPAVFVGLAKAVRASGGKAYIISGLGAETAFARVPKYLLRVGVENWKDVFDGLITSREYNADERALIGQMSNDLIVGKFKQRVCCDLGIDVMFDDKPECQRPGSVPVFGVPGKEVVLAEMRAEQT